MSILVLVEQKDGKAKTAGLELLTIAKQSGKDVMAVSLGAGSKTLAESLGKYGATKLYAFDDADLNVYNPELYAEAIQLVINEVNPKIVLGSGSASSRDILPKLAARNESGFVADAVEIEFVSDAVKLKKPMYSGKCFAKALIENSKIQFICMRPNQYKAEESGGATAELIEKTKPQKDLLTTIKEVVEGASKKLDLTEANIIVSGGRGMKEAANFKVLEELADTLGASVGASRAVVDAGWVPHSMQVGQTGKTVAPTLYFACGISGAIQHLAGMNTSKVIVAINTDPEAPIFQKATYGIVGDALQVVPLLNEEFKKVLN